MFCQLYVRYAKDMDNGVNWLNTTPDLPNGQHVKCNKNPRILFHNENLFVLVIVENIQTVSVVVFFRNKFNT